ncbi:transposable element Tc1 transposase [Trichonephila clavipes]|nr:transposable element Tc1 transposase [Trichonephila clavipes]
MGDDVFVFASTYYDSVSVHIRRFKKYRKTYYPTPEGITLDPRWIEYIMRKKKVPESLEELPSGLFPPEQHIQITSENFIDFTFKHIKYGPDKEPTFKEIPIFREQWAEMFEKYGAIENAGQYVSVQFERGLIIRRKTAGWSTRRVAGQVDRSECAVRNCWEQWTREGTHARKTGSGATRKTTRREDRRIVRQTLVDPTATRSTIRADVGVAIVPQTISRHLAEANLKSKLPFRALPLTPEHRQLRLQWC